MEPSNVEPPNNRRLLDRKGKHSRIKYLLLFSIFLHFVTLDIKTIERLIIKRKFNKMRVQSVCGRQRTSTVDGQDGCKTPVSYELKAFI